MVNPDPAVRKSAIYVAEYVSQHFAFMAAAEDPKSARANLIRGLKRHGRSNPYVEPSPHTWFDPDDINIYEVPVGGCLRDGMVI